jgi:UDP-N-acetylglucosamine 4,6-dehydratase/5-epimerase
MINNKTILITGGTGSFGSVFVEYLLKKYNPKKIIIFSRDEQKHFLMEKKLSKFRKKLRFFIGDVRDLNRLEFATKNVDILIHAAAMKHVLIAEYNPFEVVKTNVMGAQNVIDACLKNNIKKVIALSTDKASSPVNIYGASKLTSDKLFIAANNYSGRNKNIFSVVRYGNVLGSKGSILPLFLKGAKKKLITITDKRMTRFNITLEESVLLVIKAINSMVGGEIFVPKIPSFKVTDLAKAISNKSRIKIIGIKPGEKLHEELISINEAQNAVEYKKHYIITSNSELFNWNKKNYLKKFGGKSCALDFCYNSFNNKDQLSIAKLKKIIQSEISKLNLE